MSGGAIDRIVFNGPAGGFSIDDMALTPGAAQPVPEPGSWALMLAGAAVLAALGRRRATIFSRS